MNEEYEDSGDAELEEEQGEEAGFGSFIQESVRGLPWWAISMVLHLIIVCFTMLIIIERPFKKEEREMQTGIVKPEPISEEVVEPKEPEPETSTKDVKEDEPKVEDPVVKHTKVAERTESANDDEHQQQKGQEEGVTDSPLKGKFSSSEIGVGGNAGSTFGGRFGGKQNLVRRNGGSKATEDAVRKGLEWLKKHQGSDGRWDCDGFMSNCSGKTSESAKCDGGGESWCDVGVTGLALLAFLGAGNTTSIGDYKDVVNRGVQYLRNVQTEDGCFGTKDGHYMYNHAIAALAMTEAYALSNYFPLLKESAQKGTNFLIEGQNPGKAWRYAARDGDNDTSVTGWCVMALKSAKVAGLNVPATSFEGAKTFLNLVTNDYHRAGYREDNPGAGTGIDGFLTTESLTAVAMTARVFMGTEPTNAHLTGGASLLRAQKPNWGQDQGKSVIDYYYWYYGTLAMFQMGGQHWTDWNEQLKTAIVPHQEQGGCKDGSWPINSRWGNRGGRVYTTALNVLSLEIYYRYDKVFK